jgi:hypothetical protein
MLERRSACCRQPEVSNKGHDPKRVVNREVASASTVGQTDQRSDQPGSLLDERELTDEHPHGHKRHDDERIHPINRHGSVPQEGNGNNLIPEQR